MRGVESSTGPSLRRAVAVPALALLLGAGSGLVLGAAQAATPPLLTQRVSLGAAEAQGNAASEHPSISSDGRYVAFASEASNLVAGDANGVADVFVRDRVTGTTRRVSVSSAGTEGTAASGSPAISGSGGHIAFTSSASFVAGDTNGVSDVFLHEVATSTTVRLSSGPKGAAGDGPSSSPVVSANGRRVAFVSRATNLVDGDSNGASDVFLSDLGAAALERVSVAGNEAEANGGSAAPAISGDGSTVAFVSSASNLVAADGPNKDVFVRDVSAGTTAKGSAGGTTPTSGGPALDADGSVLAFHTTAALAGGDTNGTPDVYVRDFLAATTVRASLADDESQLAAGGTAPSVSADGGRVAFRTQAVNLTPGDSSDADVFVRDLGAGSTDRYTVANDGTEFDSSLMHHQLSGAGHHVVFDSSASDVVAEDSNGSADVFVVGPAGPDSTPPVVVPVYDPPEPDGADGWWASPLTVSWSIYDAESNVFDVDFCGEARVTGTFYASPYLLRCFPQSAGGTRYSQISVRVDTVPPQVTCDPAPTFVVDEAGAVSAQVTDANSGTTTPTLTSSVSTGEVGRYTAEVIGTDRAGWSTSARCAYRVIYDFTGYLPPVLNPPGITKVAAGSTARLSFDLAGFHGTDVVARAGSAKVRCRSGALPQPTIQHARTVSYSTTSGAYTYRLPTRAAWRGTCRVVTVRLDDGTAHRAKLRFT